MVCVSLMKSSGFSREIPLFATKLIKSLRKQTGIRVFRLKEAENRFVATDVIPVMDIRGGVELYLKTFMFYVPVTPC